MKPVLFFVLDGLADFPQKGKTPLSCAAKPNLDWLASRGEVGELKVLPSAFYQKGKKGSHLANVKLLGFSPYKFMLRRGPLEAVGAEVAYREGELALRCNFATVDKDLKVVDRRAGRATWKLDELAKRIQAMKFEVPFTFKRTFEHRAVLILRKKLSAEITSNDSKVGEKVKRIRALQRKAKPSAKLLQKFVDCAHELLEEDPANKQRQSKGLLPANYLLVREPGNELFALPNFSRKWKRSCVCLAENGVMKATCLLAGFDTITIPELPFEETLKFVFCRIEECLDAYDFIYVHLKEFDKHAHDGNFEAKARAIEAFDSWLGKLRSFEGILIVTCDHITSCLHRSHLPGKVPLLVYGKEMDRVKRFDELSVQKGSLKNFTPLKLWKYVLQNKK